LKFVQKKFKIIVDAPLAFWDIGLTHGNNRTTTQHKMRTKTLLLTAAALLAAGIMTSQAQSPVYSQNIVGYATVVTPASGTYYMLSIPFKIGVSNGANEIWPSGALPELSTLLTWDVPSQSYKGVLYDSTSPTLWDNGNYDPVPAPILPVGQGFLLNLTAPATNVFAGTVAINVGTSNQMSLPNSGTYYMVGSVVPYAGSVTNGTSSGGGANLNGLPELSTVLTWDVPSQSYKGVLYDSTSPTLWDNGNYDPVPAPTLTVGQGFFINLTGPYTWTTGL
jgi:hypothetical protein